MYYEKGHANIRRIFTRKKQQLKSFDEKLSSQGIEKNNHIYNFIDYLTYNSDLNKQIKNEKSKNKRTIVVSLFIPGFISLGGELWQLIKINTTPDNSIVIVLGAAICLTIAMLVFFAYFPQEKTFRIADLDKDDKIVIALKEVIIYRSGSNPTLVDREDA
ncbi:hypothetical protein TEHAL1_13490 [Tetragenococcus halophilus]|nr:hypothetical protein TEHAL1_13490 [Tetragenococcus halophilus]